MHHINYELGEREQNLKQMKQNMDRLGHQDYKLVTGEDFRENMGDARFYCHSEYSEGKWKLFSEYTNKSQKTVEEELVSYEEIVSKKLNFDPE